MENEFVKDVLDLANRYPNDSELGKNVRMPIRKYKEHSDTNKKKEGSLQK